MNGRKCIRLYVRGKILGYKRSVVNQYNSTSLIKVDGVESREETVFYRGKRIVYIYKSKNLRQGTKYRCIWGKITRAHGNSGVVRAKFHKNLTPHALGEYCRVMLYPSNL